MVLVRCDGCHKEVDKNGVEPIYEQRLQGKVAWFCNECNQYFYDYRGDINKLWEDFDRQKAKEKEEIRKKWFVKSKQKTVIDTVVVKENAKVKSNKINAQVVAEEDLAEVSRGTKDITEDEIV